MKRMLAAGFAAALTLVAAACGDDPGNSNEASDAGDTSPRSSASAEASPAATAGASTVPDDAPQRIISMSGTHTEMLFAIGAGDQVIAVDEQSDYPEEVSELQAGLSAFEPNVESIASLEPDLVVLSDDRGLVDQLETLGIEYWFGGAAVTFDDMYAQIEQLGAITGHVGEAAELVSQIQTDLDQLTEDIPETAQPLTVYHELDPNLYSATSETFIGAVYEAFGLVNIADGANAGPYPQLSAEYIVDADPDLIFLADWECCNQNAATVAERDGWGQLSAVRNDMIVGIPDDIASRWGPRVVELARRVREAVVEATELQRAG